MTNISYPDRLRWFADWLDGHPSIINSSHLAWEYPSLYLYAHSAEEFSELVSTIGAYEKSGYGGSISAVKRAKDRNDDTVWRLEITVSGVCKKVPKLDEHGQQVTRPKRTYVETDETEEVWDYECPQVWNNLTSSE